MIETKKKPKSIKIHKKLWIPLIITKKGTHVEHGREVDSEKECEILCQKFIENTVKVGKEFIINCPYCKRNYKVSDFIACFPVNAGPKCNG